MDLKKRVQRTITEIYEKNGKVSPSELVESARSKKSPIHDAFEWDNLKAGDQFRLMQARTWIKKVEVIVEERPERLIHVPRVVEGSAGVSEGFYKPVSMIVKSSDEYTAALEETMSRLSAAKESFRYLKTAKPLNSPIVNFEKADEGFQIVEEALNV